MKQTLEIPGMTWSHSIPFVLVALAFVAPESARAQGTPAPGTAPAPTPTPATAPPRQAGGAAPSDDAFKMGSPPQLAPGTTEPQMWPAATEDGWKKPVLIPFQRSFDDALRVAKMTGKPIMVCVNMDGEIASEHWAGVRYRDPETAKLFEPYVCVAASVYRHTPRDHDADGRRVPCPRLGSMTCGEHIAAETELYDRYFDGSRISPRHLVLEPDGKETLDVYFSWDTQTVVTTLVKGAANRPPPRPIPRDLPIADRTQSPDVTDRDAIETEYLKSTVETRRALLTSVLERRVVDQIDLLRLAIFGLDRDLARIARQALARSETEAAVDLIAEALQVPLAAEERELLLAAAERLAIKFPRAHTVSAVNSGLASASPRLDPRRFAELEYASRARANSPVDPATSLEGRASAYEASPSDAMPRLALAESLLERAEDPATERKFARLLASDAGAAARAAVEAGASGWRPSAILAAVADWEGDAANGRKHALAAVEAGMLTAGAGVATIHERTLLRVVALFASARQHAIRESYRERKPWPPEWLSDVNAAYALVSKNAFATDEQLVSFHDFLRWLGGAQRARAILDEALERFPASPLAHDRLRTRLLFESGPTGLETGYATRVARDPSNPDLQWFAGYAALVAAEHRRREGDAVAALAAYDRGIAYFDDAARLRPETAANAGHFAALGLAGRARLALERGELERAVDETVASLERSPGAGATPDGLNITPVDTAKMLRARLEEAGKTEPLAKLQAALDALDPKLLEKRAFELDDPRQNRRPRDSNR